MRLQLDDENFEVYQLRGKDRLLVAIPSDYVETINNAVKEYGKIEDIPVDKTVRGIFINNKSGIFKVGSDEPQSDIVMNQLTIV